VNLFVRGNLRNLLSMKSSQLAGRTKNAPQLNGTVVDPDDPFVCPVCGYLYCMLHHYTGIMVFFSRTNVSFTFIVYSDHIQIFLRTRSEFTYQALNRLLGISRGNDWETCQSPARAWDYCGEEKEDPSSRHGCISHSIGVRPTERARSGGRPTDVERSLRLGTLRDGLLRGESLSILARDEQCFELFIKHPGGIKFVHQLLNTPSNTPEVIRNCSFAFIVVFGEFRISCYYRSGARVMSMSTGERLEQVNHGQYVSTVKLLDLLSGFLPSVPEGFGTMATTITIVHSSTTSQVKCHSATCLTSSKAIACSCLSKEDSSVGSLQWCSLPATDRQTNGGLPSVKSRAFSRKASMRNLKDESQRSSTFQPLT